MPKVPKITSFFPISQGKIHTIILDANITQKVAISLQYIQKEVSDGVVFSYVGKHESSLQINTLIFDGHGQIFSKFPKYQVCSVFIISPQTS